MCDPHIEFHSAGVPLGYLISFRAYGTWLHGDARGAIDRFHNRYGAPYLPPNATWHSYNERALKVAPVRLSSQRRAAIDNAINETCALRNWRLHASNVRTNHVHAVVSAPCDPETVLRALKANATRKLREGGYWKSDGAPWSSKGSKRWLWTSEELRRAIAYVQDGQGAPL